MTAPTDGDRPRVAPGFRLQWEPAQESHVLLYPEGMIKLNQSGGEIMKRCDGRRDVVEMVSELERVFEVRGLRDDILAFLAMAGQQGWLVWDGGSQPS